MLAASLSDSSKDMAYVFTVSMTYLLGGNPVSVEDMRGSSALCQSGRGLNIFNQLARQIMISYPTYEYSTIFSLWPVISPRAIAPELLMRASLDIFVLWRGIELCL